MSFEIIKGGLSEDEENNILKKQEQLMLFVTHMRSIESSISVVRSQAKKFKWEELDSQLDICNKEIMKALSFVKKSKKNAAKNKEKPILRVVKDEEI